ncbi:MAG: hypothetical protein AB8H80_06845 [Planctomycetota bacterium]
MKTVFSISLLLALAPAAIAQCTITGAGTADPAPPLDGWNATAVPIGFSFPFNGTTYTDLFYSDHGLLALSNGGTPVPNGAPAVYEPAAANLDTIGLDIICAYWGDHTVQALGVPTAPAGLFVDNTSGNYCTVTWVDNEPFDSFTAGAFSVSVTLFPSGEIRICLDGRCNNTSSTFGALETVIGVHQFGNPIPAALDLSMAASTTTDATAFEEFVGPGPANTNTPDPNFDLSDTTITFTPLSPGWLVLTDTLACASTASVGTGCGGLTLTSASPPAIGMSWDFDLSGITIPAPIPNFVALGVQTPPAPIGVLFPNLFGATCTAYMDASFGLLDIGAATAGVASGSLPIPAVAALKGFSLAAQGLAFDPAGPPTFFLSNGETGIVGY